MYALSDGFKELTKHVLALILADLTPEEVFFRLFSEGINDLSVLSGGKSFSQFTIATEFVPLNFLHNSLSLLRPVLLINDGSCNIVHFS